MKGFPTGFWGKFQQDPAEWHPLLDHCADVAACCEALLQRTLLGARLARLAGLLQLDQYHVARLAVIAALHDVGKFNHGFQDKIRPGAPRHGGYVGEGRQLFQDETYGTNAIEVLGLESMIHWFGPVGDEALSGLLLASLAHHGEPVREPESSAARISLWGAQRERDPLGGLAALGSILPQWFPEAFEGGSPLDARGPFQHTFCGLIMLSDWMGSDREWFPYSEIGDGDRIVFSRSQAGRMLRVLGLDTAKFQQRLQPLPSFSRCFDKFPRPFQSLMQNSGHTPCSFGHTFHTYASVAMSLLCPKKRIPSGLLWNSMTLP